jgi:uncharacterized membrane protein
MSEPASANRLELILRRLLGIGVLLSSTTLAAGLVATFIAGPSAFATLLLWTGVLLLIATPVARVAVSSVGYAVRRDWMFVILTLIVLAELVASIVAALRGRP